MRGVVYWLVASCLALAGCDDQAARSTSRSSTSRSATITAKVATYSELSENDGTPTGRTKRQVFIKVQPHCVDRSSSLDCEGWYTLMAHYSYRRGRPEGLRCEQQPTGISFVKAGLYQLTPALPSSALPPVDCDDATPGRFRLEASLPMADTSKFRGGPSELPPATFTASLQLTAKQGRALRYQWRSRDGANCAGRLSTSVRSQRIECQWG